MSRRTIENCRVIKSAVQEGIGEPLKEMFNNKEFCQGYQKSDYDDEPYHKCTDCHINIFYQNN